MATRAGRVVEVERSFEGHERHQPVEGAAVQIVQAERRGDPGGDGALAGGGRPVDGQDGRRGRVATCRIPTCRIPTCRIPTCRVPTRGVPTRHGPTFDASTCHASARTRTPARLASAAKPGNEVSTLATSTIRIGPRDAQRGHRERHRDPVVPVGIDAAATETGCRPAATDDPHAVGRGGGVDMPIAVRPFGHRLRSGPTP